MKCVVAARWNEGGYVDHERAYSQPPNSANCAKY